MATEYLQSTVDALERCTILGQIGGGRRCAVMRARTDEGRDIVLKYFSPEATAKHARYHPVPLARFEFERNAALHRVEGLQGCIARPLGFVAVEERQVLAQEFVEGVELGAFIRSAAEAEARAVAAELARIVSVAHAAGVFDLDLHPANVLVIRHETREPSVALFDFNKIPYHLKPPNPLARLLVTCGIIGPRSRDLRRLHAIRRQLTRRTGWLGSLYYTQTPVLIGELEPLIAAL